MDKRNIFSPLLFGIFFMTIASEGRAELYEAKPYPVEAPCSDSEADCVGSGAYQEWGKEMMRWKRAEEAKVEESAMREIADAGHDDGAEENSADVTAPVVKSPVVKPKVELPKAPETPKASGGGGDGKPVVKGADKSTTPDDRQAAAEFAKRDPDRRRPGESAEEHTARLTEQALAQKEKQKVWLKNLLKDGNPWGDENDQQLDPKDLKKKRQSGFKGPGNSSGGVSPGGTSPGGKSPRGRGGMKGFAGRKFRPVNKFQRGIQKLASVPSINEAIKREGINVGSGASEQDLIAAQEVLNGLPLQAMMQVPGILNQVGGRSVYERVVNKVENGEGGEDTKHITADHNSLLWEKSCTKGLEDCNKHSKGTSYSAGSVVPAPTVSSIYESLFGDDSGQDYESHHKLAKSALGKSRGAGIWDRIKGAFSGIGGVGSVGTSGEAQPRLAAVGSAGSGSRGIGRRAPAQMGAVQKRGNEKSGVPDFYPQESRDGLTVRDYVWGVSGSVGFTILLVWAFRKKNESGDEDSIV